MWPLGLLFWFPFARQITMITVTRENPPSKYFAEFVKLIGWLHLHHAWEYFTHRFTDFFHCCNVTQFAFRLILLSMCATPHVLEWCTDHMSNVHVYKQFKNSILAFCIVLDICFCKSVCFIIIFVACNARNSCRTVALRF
jgi:hypothetical protein